VIDFGPPNATMHKRDEAVALDDLETLARIYRRIAAAALAT
jgi:succinyl-diaminopimelate desuccinylase